MIDHSDPCGCRWINFPGDAALGPEWWHVVACPEHHDATEPTHPPAVPR